MSIIHPETVDLLDYSNLTEAEHRSLAMLDGDDPDEFGPFFRYRNNVYSFSDFSYIQRSDSVERANGYIGRLAETVFPGILISETNTTDNTVNVATWSE